MNWQVQFDALSWNLRGGTEERHKGYQWRQTMSRTIFKPQLHRYEAELISNWQWCPVTSYTCNLRWVSAVDTGT